MKTYLSLLDRGASTAGDLAKYMGVKRSSAYGYLERLLAAGLVSQSMRHGIKLFAAEPGERLQLVHRRKLEELQKQQTAFDKILPELAERSVMNLFRPRLQFYEGQEGVQRLNLDILEYQDLESYTMWPIKSMRDIMTPDFLYYHNKMRIRKNISIKAIWQRDQAIDFAKNAPPDLGSGGRYIREIRLAPDPMKFTMGYWIYANKVAFLSSRSESFGFLIESAELTEILLSQHRTLWEISERVEIKPKGAQLFFDEVDEI